MSIVKIKIYFRDAWFSIVVVAQKNLKKKKKNLFFFVFVFIFYIDNLAAKSDSSRFLQ